MEIAVQWDVLVAVAESPIIAIAARAAAWRGAASPERAEAFSAAAQSTPRCSSQKRGRQAAATKAARARLRHRSHACVSGKPSCARSQKYLGWSAQATTSRLQKPRPAPKMLPASPRSGWEIMGLTRCCRAENNELVHRQQLHSLRETRPLCAHDAPTMRQLYPGGGQEHPHCAH